MGIVRVWIKAFIAISIIILSWFVYTGIDSEFQPSMDNLTTDLIGNNSDAQQAYNQIQTYKNSTLLYSGVIFVIVIIIWAYMKTQEQVRYTGRYRA